MKKDLGFRDIVWKRIKKHSFAEKWDLSKSELITIITEMESDLYNAVSELIVSTWSESNDEKYVTDSREHTIKFLKNEGYIKDTEK